MFLHSSVTLKHITAGAAIASPSSFLCQKKNASGYMGNAGKAGGDEKWAQAAMEYIYEKNHLNDSRKRQSDVDQERGMADAYDRFRRVNETAFDERLSRLLSRMSGALEMVRELGLADCLEEAVLLNTEQPPGLFRVPTLSPPLMGYEPGFGLDIPQLRSRQAEYPSIIRPTDHLDSSKDHEPFQEEKEEEEEDLSEVFPFVSPHKIEDLVRICMDQLEEQHSAIREAAPLTGVEGEAWEASITLQRKALARQQLIIDLSNSPDFDLKYTTDEAFREKEWEKRGLLPLFIEPAVVEDAEDFHFAQEPAYHPFRKA
ncbi:unnamed protein product [Phytomonas sp. Hart1]|nr:unnamed protein product [Phytomonas sp. Hart1]|eukprot:CCW66235.1 unnamed protein product [Phytomonas sp. isolate Hart1]